jgi:hypothetical protein
VLDIKRVCQTDTPVTFLWYSLYVCELTCARLGSLKDHPAKRINSTLRPYVNYSEASPHQKSASCGVQFSRSVLAFTDERVSAGCRDSYRCFMNWGGGANIETTKVQCKFFLISPKKKAVVSVYWYLKFCAVLFCRWFFCCVWLIIFHKHAFMRVSKVKL